VDKTQFVSGGGEHMSNHCLSVGSNWFHSWSSQSLVTSCLSL